MWRVDSLRAVLRDIGFPIEKGKLDLEVDEG